MSSSDNKAEAQFANLDDLFSADLDDIADLPSFEVPAKGAYIGDVTTEVKEINGKAAIEATYTVVETVELEAAEDKAPEPGTKFSTAFILGNSISEGKLKEFLAPFAAHFGTTKVGELIRDHVKAVRIAFVLKHRTDKEDKEKKYADVRNITVV